MPAVRTLALVAAATPCAAATAQGLVHVDFDTTTPAFVFGFSQGGQLTFDDTLTAPGAGGGNAGRISIAEVSGQPDFAGGGFSSLRGGDPAFDLSELLGVAPGNFTRADFEDLAFSADFAVSTGASVDSVRFEVNGFNDRVQFDDASGIENGGTFETSFLGLR